MKKVISIIIITAMLLSFNVQGAENMKPAIRDVSVHDPSIIKADGQYYVFGSHITTAKSSDMISWDYAARGYQREGNVHFGNLSQNLKGSFLWAGEDDSDCKGGFAVWAPDVYYNKDYLWEDGTKGGYMMYYSASSTYKRSCMGLAVSKTIDGIYEYKNTVVYSGFTKVNARDARSTHNKRYTNTHIDELIKEGVICGYKNDWGVDDYNNRKYPNAIDPCVYEDREGNIYLTYGSWSGGIFSLKLDKKTGLPIYPGVDSVTEDGRMVDRYFGTHIAGGKGWSGEGPFVWYDEETDYFYLQTTYEWLGTDGGYHIRMFRSENPLGPFVDLKGNNAVYGENHQEHGIKMFGNYAFDNSTAYTSGGHCSSLIDDDGKRFVYYHTRFKGTDWFQLRVNEMFVNEDGWYVMSPIRYTGDTKKASSEEIAGLYEYINHGSNIGEGSIVKRSCTVELTADGKIKGAAEGFWQEKDGYITFNMGEDIYKGVVFKQYDENGEEKVLFSLVGGNNEALWGKRLNNTEAELKTPAMVISFDFDKADENIEMVSSENGKEPAPDLKHEKVFEEGVKNEALKLEGFNGFKLKNVNTKGDFTLSFWLKPGKIKTYTPIVAMTNAFINEGGDKWFSLTTFKDGDNAVLWSRNASRNQWLQSESKVPYKLNQWQHITLVFDKKYAANTPVAYSKLYIDGYCVAGCEVDRDAVEGDIYFGINPWDEKLMGLIDEIQIFPEALSHTEVLTNFENMLK